MLYSSRLAGVQYVYVLVSLILIPFVPAAYGQQHTPSQPDRRVSENVLVSLTLPEIRIQINDAFRYLGKFEFTIRDIAYGERHVFVDDREGKVERIILIQSERFLPDNTLTYNYSFSQAEVIAGHRFRQNTWAYSNRQAFRKNPDGEGALTATFIRDKGLELEDELMMSRFLMVPDKARRNEMILAYVENASSTGHNISSFYDSEDNPTSHWRQIADGLTQRSRSAFQIQE